MISGPVEEILPIPIDDTVLAAAYRLKRLGLAWSPHVGCFVWDREAVISAPSPFPKRVYFVLSMRRFTDIFGSEENMRQQLVWVPTWHQAIGLCSRLGVAGTDADRFFDGRGFTSGEDGLLQLYARIARQLDSSVTQTPAGIRAEQISNQKRWIGRVMDAEVGGLAHLPQAVRRRVQSVYEEVGMAYLGWRRIQEERSADWIPPEATFDARLLSDLGHFYSDYQHVIRSMAVLRERVRLIQSIDPSTAPDAYQRLIQELLAGNHPDSGPGRILTDLMDSG